MEGMWLDIWPLESEWGWRPGVLGGDGSYRRFMSRRESQHGCWILTFSQGWSFGVG